MPDDDTRRTELLTALTTEQFVLQSMRATSTGEAGSRGFLFVGALSSALVALGFVAQFEDVFSAFAAAVIPALLVLGLFTYVRLAEIGVEDLTFMHRIQRIRAYYRELSPDAARYFPGAAKSGWQAFAEAAAVSRTGRFNYLFTMASMVGAINSIVAGVGVALLLDGAFGVARAVAVVVGVAVALGAMAAHGHDEQRRFRRLQAEQEMED
jgi:hypothetical protein